MKLFLILILLFFMSCDSVINQKKLNLQNYTCSSSQIKQVDEETDACSKTNHSSSWCFDQAKISICTYTNRINSE